MDQLKPYALKLTKAFTFYEKDNKTKPYEEFIWPNNN